MTRRRKVLPRLAPGASPFRLRVGRSPIHRFGVFALQDIAAHRKIIEYAGKRISVRDEHKLRQIDPRRAKRVYYFSLNKHWGIYGADGGSGAELINHSCDPNIKERIIRGHILYFSRRRIRAGEELSIDYRFQPDCGKYPCRCGAAKCRGTINLLPSAKRKSKRSGSRRP